MNAGSAGHERVFVGLGSNLGDRESHLSAALVALRATPGIEDVVPSPIYETEPVGPAGQGPYLNAVAELRTDRPPHALLARLLAIERAAGRRRSGARNEARTLDLDLLLCGVRRIDEEGLVVPHPRLHERPFVLVPLRDLAPELVVPGLGVSIAALVARLGARAVLRRWKAADAGKMDYALRAPARRSTRPGSPRA